jgi:hypothetical protein
MKYFLLVSIQRLYICIYNDIFLSYCSFYPYIKTCFNYLNTNGLKCNEKAAVSLIVMKIIELEELLLSYLCTKLSCTPMGVLDIGIQISAIRQSMYGN